MPRPTKKANKKKTTEPKKRVLPLKDECQVYARVLRNLGDRRFECLCEDNILRIARNRNTRSFKKENQKIDIGLTVLLSLREFDTSKADIIAIYSATEARRLDQLGHYSPKKDEVIEPSDLGFQFEELPETEKEEETETIDITAI